MDSISIPAPAALPAFPSRLNAAVTPMHIWHLVRTDDVDWDENQSMVVRARTEHDAREFAARAATTESCMCWLMPERSSATVIGFAPDQLGMAPESRPAVLVTDNKGA